jgi:hypothetical protein
MAGLRDLRVVMTAYNRPGYLAETLSSWGRVRGSGKCFFDFYIDPSEETERVRNVITGGMEVAGNPLHSVHVNPVHLGVLVNPYRAFETTFTESFTEKKPDDFVILAEDDFVVGEDTLEYFAWASTRYAKNWRVLAVSATQLEPQGAPDEVLQLAGWTGWVWGTWRDRWESLLKPDWAPDYRYGGWDWRIINHWCGDMGMSTVVPALSRSQHIGKHGGAHTNPDTFEQHVSRCFTPNLPPQQYVQRIGMPVELPCHHFGT